MIKIENTGLDEAVTRLSSANVREKSQFILDETAQLLVSFARQCIKSGVSPDGTPYAPLAESTIRKKELRAVFGKRHTKSGANAEKKIAAWYAKGGYSILRETGEMVRGIMARRDRNALVFGDTKGYATFHQGNTRDYRSKHIIPRRAFFPLDEKLRLETANKGGEFWVQFRDRLIRLL